jgi:hypothetical protein
MSEHSPSGSVIGDFRRQRQSGSVETADANNSQITLRIEGHNYAIEPAAIVADDCRRSFARDNVGVGCDKALANNETGTVLKLVACWSLNPDD